MSEKAMKLFEALSGVDPELLERCGGTSLEKKKKVKGMIFQRYGRAMAACICLLAVGALSWGGYRLVWGPCGSADSGNGTAAAQNQTAVNLSDMEVSAAPDMAGGAGDSYQAPEAPSQESVKEYEGNQDTLTFGETSSDKAESGSRAPIQDYVSELQIPMTSAGNTAEAAGAAGIEAQRESEAKKETVITDSRREIEWEQACALEPFSGYFPTVIPEGYQPFSARRSALPQEWNEVLFQWSSGNQRLYLEMSVVDAKRKESATWSQPENYYSAEEFTRELIPEPSEDGEIRFTVYYPDGVELLFAGSVSRDEFWEMYLSVPAAPGE